MSRITQEMELRSTRRDRIAHSLRAGLCVLGLLVSAVAPAAAQSGRISLIRDAEIEATIRAFATPVFGAAGLNARDIRVHLVQDNTLNAFVAGGLNMFLNTGLLIRTEHAGQVLGVIAHESGHISGGHLARVRDAMRAATAESILAMVLGAAAGIAARNPQAGMAGIALGNQIAERGLLAYSRDMEAAADQAGLRALERSGFSARGMMEFFALLVDQELVSVGRQDPYVRSHPITRDRVEFVRDALTRSPTADARLPANFVEMHARMRAKLIAYLDPGRGLTLYPEGDRTLVGRYGRAIALYRRGQNDAALALMAGLIRERPNDPWFHEFRAQILLESQRPREALPGYQRAVQLRPSDAILLTELAQAQVAIGTPDMLRVAVQNLERSRQLDNTMAETFRLLAVAYGQQGQVGMSNWAQAELNMLRGNRVEARAFAERAIRDLPPGSPAALRAEDIRSSTERRN